MSLRERVRRGGLNHGTAAFLVLALVFAILHHADHVLRVDHSGWPFRRAVTPFTFSLLAYPMILFALFGGRRWFWMRWVLLTIGTAFTILAHTVIETPQMQYVMWADDHSLDPRGKGLCNLLGLRSPTMGLAAVVLGMTLNITAVAATVSMLVRGLHLRRRSDVEAG